MKKGARIKNEKQTPSTHSPRGFFGEQFVLPDVEDRVLKFWEEDDTFAKSVSQNKNKKSFVFYEGPPTANGHPGIHHVLARSFKDILCRYKTMQGFFVPRRAGWDTHGLPVELQVEKALGLKSKKDIEAYGVAAFNKKCRESVWEFKDEWEQLTRRMGFWVDLENPYVTYETPYIETLWWIISRMWEKKMLYQGHKIVPWCTRCGTSLSSHELGQPGAYQTVTDNSVYVKFRLKPGQAVGKFPLPDTVFVLSWTTTPWTLPGNVALAVGEEIAYGLYKQEENYFILATDSPLAKEFSIVNGKKFLGKDLVGLEYQPLFAIPTLSNDHSHKIYGADFVTTTDGTGVVHTAVMYGEDDYALGKTYGLPQHHTVDEAGKFTTDVSEFAGRYVKSKETEQGIFEYLQQNDNLFRVDPYEHEYPHCWRCNTPLLYYAQSSWFVAMSSIKQQLQKENKKINWIPGHIKEGRFGEWLADLKDWNFSRQRYWGTPLPIWKCGECGRVEVIAGRADLSTRLGGSTNNYFIMRHGESEAQKKHRLDSGDQNFHLTKKGIVEVERAVPSIKKQKIDLIVASPLPRTRQTAEIVSKATGAKLIFDDRLKEVFFNELSGQDVSVYHLQFPTYQSKFSSAPIGGESLRDVRARVWHFLSDIEREYANKTILFISHDDPLWMLETVASGWNERESIFQKNKRGDDFVATAEFRPLSFLVGPRNETGEYDLHRPYIDSVTFACDKCSGVMARVPELADVWFDSGAMPYAQAHFPFEKGQKLTVSGGRATVAGIEYPADYIAEATDQTRGWFYTLLAVSSVLGLPAAYRAAVCLGLINDKHGKKMSKSKGNIVNPWDMAKTYGMDGVRWYFYTVNPPGEPKNFDERDVVAATRRVHLLIYNSFVFYKTYANKQWKSSHASASSHVLDVWMMAQLNQTVFAATQALDSYDVREAALCIERLVDDLSRWYIRRIRRRLQKPESSKDHLAASAVLGETLSALARLMAPFSPFFAEALTQELHACSGSLKNYRSVHLQQFPKASKPKKTDTVLFSAMEEVRRVASVSLSARASAAIKVRQPLASVSIKNTKSLIRGNSKLLAILADEVNVKNVLFDAKLSEDIVLDVVITPELKSEGMLREIVRGFQELRQEAHLVPTDTPTVATSATFLSREQIDFIAREVNASVLKNTISKNPLAVSELDIDGATVRIAIEKK